MTIATLAPLTPSAARQAWVDAAVLALRARIADLGQTVPDALRVTVGWPAGSRAAIGQCWPACASSDSHVEIWVSPELSDSARILDVLAHELAHAAVGNEHGHKGPFATLARALGLEGRLTATVAGAEFKLWAADVIAAIGSYPAGSLSRDGGRKKQATRLLKVECADCGYVARVTRKWVDTAGAPLCPCNHEPMRCEGGDGEGEGE